VHPRPRDVHLFGSDYPPVWFPLAESIQILDSAALPAEPLEVVRWSNATDFFRLPVG
jgi:hypothetical protein